MKNLLNRLNLLNMKPAELLKFVQEYSNKFIVIEFYAWLEHGTDGIEIKFDESEGEFYYQSFGKWVDPKDLYESLMNVWWPDYFKEDTIEGLYEFKMVLSIEWDGDDYRRWCYYNIEHMETELSVSLEEYKKQTFPSETVLDIFNL